MMEFLASMSFWLYLSTLFEVKSLRNTGMLKGQRYSKPGVITVCLISGVVFNRLTLSPK